MFQETDTELAKEALETFSPPMVINPSPLPEQAMSGARDVVIVIGAFSAIVGFIGKRDLAGLVGWLQSSEAYPFIGLVLMAGTIIWRHIGLRRKKAQQVVLGLSAPDDVAVVKGVETRNQV